MEAFKSLPLTSEIVGDSNILKRQDAMTLTNSSSATGGSKRIEAVPICSTSNKEDRRASKMVEEDRFGLGEDRRVSKRAEEGR